jgi:TetR/AcrR family transcriptional regulator, cholesterol catabolism regulator
MPVYDRSVTQQARGARSAAGDGRAGRAGLRIREDVLAAAAKVFSERGYHGASMQDVANAAGMQKASLYHHVGQKEDLLFAIHEKMIDELTALTMPVVSSSRSPAEKIRGVIEVALEFIAAHREGATVLLQDIGAVAGPRWQAVMAKRDFFEKMVEGVIAEAARNGDFEKTRPEIAARGILGMVNWCYTWFHADGELTPREVADILAAIVITGLERRDGTPAGTL